MIDADAIAGYLDGDAIAVAARARWRILAAAPALRFLDETDLAGLRERHPDWRATPLAPVSIVSDIWTLAGVTDRSLDCLVAFHLLDDPDRAREGFAAARRVLRAGGVLILCVPDERYAPAGAHDALGGIEAALAVGTASGPWTTARIIRLAASLPPEWTGELEMEAAGRIGDEAVVVWSKGPPGGLAAGAAFQHGGRVFVMDGRLARHVETAEVLAALRPGNDAVPELGASAFRRVTPGAPMRAADVAGFLARNGRR